MSQESIEVLERIRDAFNRRDLPAFLSCCDPDIEVVSDSALIGAPTYCGHAGMEQFFRDMAVAWEELRGDIHDVEALGNDTFVVISESAGRGKTSGAPFTIDSASHVTLRHGKLARWEFFASKEDAIKAAGLSE